MSKGQILGIVTATVIGGVVSFFLTRWLEAKFPPLEEDI